MLGYRWGGQTLISAAIWIVLGLIAWLAVVQRTTLRVWIAWTSFCLVLFPALLWWRDQWSTLNVAIAAILAPVFGLLGLADQRTLGAED